MPEIPRELGEALQRGLEKYGGVYFKLPHPSTWGDSVSVDQPNGDRFVTSMSARELAVLSMGLDKLLRPAGIGGLTTGEARIAERLLEDIRKSLEGSSSWEIPQGTAPCTKPPSAEKSPQP